MKRTRIDLHDVAEFSNLASAAVRAARGKKSRPDVRRFFANFERNIARLGADILAGNAPYGIYRQFIIHDPKTRVIHAACFEDRVFHHALMHFVGPVIERALVPTSYACRPGKGPLKGVWRAQHNARRYPWYVKVDMEKYFDSIDHEILLHLLNRCCKGHGLASMFEKIVTAYETAPGKGLPIGSLTSQYFANYYLAGFDRFLLEELDARGHVRYMDDVAWWCDSRDHAKSSLQAAIAWLRDQRALRLHRNVQLNRSVNGMTFCGFRVLPGRLKLSRRRRKRYSEKRAAYERAYQKGLISELELQQAYASVRAIAVHADSDAWLGEELRRNPFFFSEDLDG